MAKKYRLCVGMMILNQNNEILVGRRLDHPSGYWQMPQGGIDQNEIPEEAVWREMMEEIGTNNADLIHTSDGGYAVVGKSKSNDLDVSENKGFDDFWISKLDSSGAMSWEYTFGFAGSDTPILSFKPMTMATCYRVF